MNPAALRAGNSGRLVQPVPSEGLFAWDGVNPIVSTIAPAVHSPGLYEIVITGFIRTTGSAGSLSATIGWNQPNAGPTTLQVNFGAVISINTITGALRVIRSAGNAPITLTYFTTGLVGSPVIELASTTFQVARPFTGTSPP